MRLGRWSSRRGRFAALELAAGVDGDGAAAGGVREDLGQRSQRRQDGGAAQAFASHGGDVGGDVVDGDLVEAAAAEVGDQVLAQRPAVDFAGALADGLAVEPLPGVLLE